MCRVREFPWWGVNGKKVADAERRYGCGSGKNSEGLPKPQECHRHDAFDVASATVDEHKAERARRRANRQEGEKSCRRNLVRCGKPDSQKRGSSDRRGWWVEAIHGASASWDVSYPVDPPCFIR